MLAIAAAVLFGIAFIINASDTTTEDIFSPTSLMLAGLTLLALHLAGVASTWSARTRRR